MPSRWAAARTAARMVRGKKIKQTVSIFAFVSEDDIKHFLSAFHNDGQSLISV